MGYWAKVGLAADWLSAGAAVSVGVSAGLSVGAAFSAGAEAAGAGVAAGGVAEGAGALGVQLIISAAASRRAGMERRVFIEITFLFEILK
jgi:hypothetical protein